MRKITAFILAFTALHAPAQENLGSDAPPAGAVETQVNGSAPIYTGREHTGYLPTIQGFAYLGTDQWQTGHLVYRGVLYPGVYLKYDLVADELIVQHFNGFAGVTLFTPRISSFSLGNRLFENLEATDENHLPASGIYEVLVKGPVSLYVKRSKAIQESVKSGEVERWFTASETYYAWKNEVFYPVKREKQMLNLVPGRKAGARTLLRDKNVRFKKQPEAALILLAQYFNAQPND